MLYLVIVKEIRWRRIGKKEMPFGNLETVGKTISTGQIEFTFTDTVMRSVLGNALPFTTDSKEIIHPSIPLGECGFIYLFCTDVFYINNK